MNFFPFKRPIHWFVRAQSNTTKIIENTVIYSKRMEIELKERKELSCYLTVILPAPKENVSPSRIKNVGGLCKSRVSRNCEAFWKKETQEIHSSKQISGDVTVSKHSLSEAQKLCCNFSSKCMYVYMHMINALLIIMLWSSSCLNSHNKGSCWAVPRPPLEKNLKRTREWMQKMALALFSGFGW